MIDKKLFTEADIRTKFITPALLGPNGSKWNLMTQVREEIYFTKGRVIVRGMAVTRACRYQDNAAENRYSTFADSFKGRRRNHECVLRTIPANG